jgi:hypothetical protein
MSALRGKGSEEDLTIDDILVALTAQTHLPLLGAPQSQISKPSRHPTS